jgi:hypothetical protein
MPNQNVYKCPQSLVFGAALVLNFEHQIVRIRVRCLEVNC